MKQNRGVTLEPLRLDTKRFEPMPIAYLTIAARRTQAFAERKNAAPFLGARRFGCFMTCREVLSLSFAGLAATYSPRA